MRDFNDIWLRGQAAQQSILQLATYNAAVLGMASVHAMRLGLNAPRAFWGAMARASVTPPPIRIGTTPAKARRSDQAGS